MSARALHLNLLHESERVSSSPVRLRIMLPVMAMLACAGFAIWWAILFGRTLLLQSEIGVFEQELAQRKAAHAKVLERMREVVELEAEAEQLGYYRSSRRTWGETLMALAEVMPLKVQLTRLEIPPPPPQDLSRPKGFKGPPLWGPTGTVERVSLFLTGRTTKETPVISMMESLESDTFTNAFVILKDPRSPSQSPKVHSFRPDATRDGKGKARMLAFEIEYRARERRFEP